MKNGFLKKDLSQLFKLWVTVAILLSSFWSLPSMSFGSRKPQESERVNMAPRVDFTSVVNAETSLTVNEIVPNSGYEDISKALLSDTSLSRAGLKSLNLRFQLKNSEGNPLMVELNKNRLSNRSDTLIFQPGRPIREMDTPAGIDSDALEMPYCLLRVAKDSTGSTGPLWKLPSKSVRGVDLWLPSQVRVEHYDNNTKLTLKLLSPSEMAEIVGQGAEGNGPKVYEELECHFNNRSFDQASLFGILKEVLGDNVEIAYTFE